MEAPKFKVVIVGGSIAGLTLAHCLDRANIDHIVLEKRAEIAPQEGAFIGIWPNGARVLDQLGVYGLLEDLAAPIRRMHICFPDGFSFSSWLPKKVHERFGYPIISLDRQKVLETLFESYPDKSRIITSKKVSEVHLESSGASVLTEDGSIFQADLVVGADGVHSRIRSEMWRLAESRMLGLISKSETKGLTVEYACVFGISSPIAGLLPGEHINRYGNGFSIITFHGKNDGTVFWFITQKLDKQYTYPNVPRFSPKDAAELCDKLADVKLVHNVSVRDLWKHREVASMSALEEGLLDTWHFDRIVLLGDSIHKMTPNIGQGANTAIEDAAVLASLINRFVQSKDSSTVCQESVESLLQEYQSLRYDRAKSTYQRSRFGARFHTRNDWIKALAGRYIFPSIGGLVEKQTAKVLATGDIVDYLPVPKRAGPGWAAKKTTTEDHGSQLPWGVLCVSSLALAWGVLWVRPHLSYGFFPW